MAYFQTKSCKIVSYSVAISVFSSGVGGREGVVVSEILDTNMTFVRPKRLKTPIPALIMR